MSLNQRKGPADKADSEDEVLDERTLDNVKDCPMLSRFFQKGNMVGSPISGSGGLNETRSGEFIAHRCQPKPREQLNPPIELGSYVKPVKALSNERCHSASRPFTRFHIPTVVFRKPIRKGTAPCFWNPCNRSITGEVIRWKIYPSDLSNRREGPANTLNTVEILFPLLSAEGCISHRRGRSRPLHFHWLRKPQVFAGLPSMTYNGTTKHTIFDNGNPWSCRAMVDQVPQRHGRGSYIDAHLEHDGHLSGTALWGLRTNFSTKPILFTQVWLLPSRLGLQATLCALDQKIPIL